MASIAAPSKPSSKETLQNKITQAESEIEKWQADHVRCTTKIASLDKRLSDLHSGRRKNGNAAKTQASLKESKESLEAVEGLISELEGKVKTAQQKLATHDDDMRAYTQAVNQIQAEKKAKQEAENEHRRRGGFMLSGLKGTNNKITSRIVRKPLESKPGAVNRPVQRQTTSTDAATQKRAGSAGIQKPAATKSSKPVKEAKKALMADAAKQAIDSTASHVDCANASSEKPSAPAFVAPTAPMMAPPTAAPTTSEPSNKVIQPSTTSESDMGKKKRKLSNLAEHDREAPAKKARSIPEQTQVTNPERQVKQTRKTRSTVKAKKSFSGTSNASKKAQTGGNGVQTPGPAASNKVDEDVEMSDADDVPADGASVEKQATEKAAHTGGRPAASSPSTGDKRKAEGGEEVHNAERPSKKILPSTEEGQAKDGAYASASKASGVEKSGGAEGDKPSAEASSTPQEDTAENKAIGKADNQEPAASSNEQVRVFVKGSSSREHRWQSMIASKDWILGHIKPTYTKEIDTPLKAGKNDEDYKLRGLDNLHNACFANAGLQILNNVLTNNQVMALRGTEPLSLFGFPYKEMFCDNKTFAKDLLNLRSNISITAALKGNIGIAPYLGQAILDMRNGVTHKCKKGRGQQFVTPIFLQQAFAYGAGQNSDRLRFKGSTQQDSQEYVMAMIEAVANEGYGFMRDLFKVEKTLTTKCTACGDESTSEFPELVIGVTTVSDDETKAESDEEAARPKLVLRDLINGALSNTDHIIDAKCEKCGAVDQRESTTAITSLSNNILVHIGRNTGSKVATPTKKTRNSKPQGKDTSAVELDFEGTQFQFGEDEYELAAVIRHEGETANEGHYTAFIKHQGTWDLLDDREKTEDLESEEMQDDQDTQCSMVLLRKVEQ